MKNLQFAYISPINYLHMVPEQSTFHLLLAHLLPNKTYSEFYKKRKAKNDTLYLDNSAFEYGRPLEGHEILKLIEESGIQPDVVVAPDYPAVKGIKTIKSAERFAEEYRKILPSSRLMFVPQSEKGDYKDWIECYKQLTALSEPGDVIGMSILGIPNAFQSLTQISDITFNRIFGTIYMKEHGLIDSKVLHHYLGLGLPRELMIQKQLGVADSCDSSSPIFHGILGIRYDESFGGLVEGKSKKAVDFLAPYDETVIQDIGFNIETFQKWLS